MFDTICRIIFCRHQYHVEQFDLSSAGGAVLIAETMLDGQKPHSALQSLNMLVQTEGMERKQRQFADLLCQHGFRDMQAVHTRNFLDALIAFKI